MRNLSKKLFFLTAIFLFQSIIWADPIALLNDDGTNITLKFSQPGYLLENVNANGELCASVTSPGATVTKNKGEPALPFFTKSLLLSNNSSVSLEIVSSKTRTIKAGNIVPSKGLIKRTEDPSTIPYIFGDVYKKNELYPKSVAALGTPYIQRDVRGVVLEVYPYQFNPVTGDLVITEEVTIKVIEKSGRAINPLTKSATEVSPMFNKLLKRKFVNYNSRASRYTKVADGDKMVIITASEYSSAVDKLVEWKNQKGIETKKYVYGSETGGSSLSALESFIQDQYDNNDITYFLIVGDYEDVPSPRESAGSDGQTMQCSKDPVMMHLNGSDKYQDAFIGRISVSSSSQAEVVINKNVWYEKTPTLNAEWYRKGLGIASSDGISQSGIADYDRMDWLKDSLSAPKYNYTTWTDVYDPGASSSAVKSALEDGRSLTLYIGHGASSKFVTSGFGTTHVSSLNNEERPTAVFSVACSNGHFSGKTSFAEAMQRAGTSTTAKGTIVFLGASIDISWVPPCDGLSEMVSLIKQDDCFSIGAVISNGLSKMVERNSSDNTYKFWHTFGDPSLSLFTDSPTEFASASAPASIGGGSQTVVIDYGEAVDGYVCLWEESSGILASKMITKSSGTSQSLSVNVPSGVQSITLTVTGRNKVPYIKTIPVQTGPSISVSSPNGGEKINTGTSFTITWDDNIDSDVKIELYKGSNSVVTLSDATASDGSFTWDVDASLSDGSDYKIKISGEGVEDMSDDNFTIGQDVADKYTLTVNKGSGDGDYTEGSSVEIIADDAPEGEIFDEWTGDVSGIDNVKSATANLVMPAEDITVTATYKEKPSDNLIFIASWESNSDDSSSVDLDTTKIFTDTLLTASYDVGASDEPNNIWPWANITGYLDTNLEGVTKIELTYKSDKAMYVILDQEGLSETGDSWQVKIDASSSWKTVSLTVDENTFSQPEWKTKTEGLDLTKVSSISFQPDVDGATANFQLESGFLYGLPTPNTFVFKAKPLAAGLNLVSSSKIGFTVKSAGNYNIKIYSLDGKTLYKSAGNFAAGSHKIDWNGSNFSKGIYLVSLEGMNKSFVRKAIFK